MARSKGTPERSRLIRERVAAFSRKHRDGGGEDKKSTDADDKTDKAGDTKDATPDAEIEPAAAETQPIVMRPEPQDLPEITPPDPKAEPWPDATPQPMRPVDAPEPTRARTQTATVGMPITDLGRPPDMPRTTAPPPLALGSVEDPTHMPGPRDIPAGDPGDQAPAPGVVPPGDSRSLRREGEFALIYRVGTCVITRMGRVGTRGQWRVVEYPTSASASNAYAKECSRFVSDGFSDYRE